MLKIEEGRKAGEEICQKFCENEEKNLIERMKNLDEEKNLEKRNIESFKEKQEEMEKMFIKNKTLATEFVLNKLFAVNTNIDKITSRYLKQSLFSTI